MECLSDLCTSNGQAIPGTQELICEAVFSDEAANADIIFRTQFKVRAGLFHGFRLLSDR